MSKALVVDDHPAQRFIIRRFLEDAGYAVVDVSSARLALEEVSNHLDESFSLIVCDLKMPEVDGISFVKLLGGCQFKQNSILFISSHEPKIISAAEVVAKHYNMNVLSSLRKPIKRESLLHAISNEKKNAPTIKPPSKREVDLIEIDRCLKAGHFLPYYQPKFDVVSLKCIGAEMLARCFHPDHGVLAPDEFSALFKNKDAEAILMRQLLTQSFSSLAKWNNAGFRISLAINFNWHLFKNDSFLTFLKHEVVKRNIDPNDLVIEIVESEAMTDLPVALGNMASLRLHGFGIALDDFGSGYANFEKLAHLPLTQIKLDRSLLSSAKKRIDGMTVLAATVDLAKKLVGEVVLEGIEDKQDLNIARQLGIRQGQGYFFSKPIPEHEFESRYIL